MTEETKQQAGKFTIKNVRLAFPHLFEPKAAKAGGTPKFSAALIFPKDHPQLADLRKLVEEVAVAKWGDKAAETLKALKATNKICVYDGDGKAEFPGYAGNLFINASNTVRPLTLGAGPDGRAPVDAKDGKLYAGCYVNAIIQVWAQQHAEHGKRINAALLGVQFFKDGERLAGGSTAAADDFEAIPQEGQQKAAASGAGAAGLF